LSFHRHLTVIIETQEESTTIKTYPTIIKPNNQAKKGDVHDCPGEKHVYTPLAEGQDVYLHNYQEKPTYMCEKKAKLRRRLRNLDLE
jgi:hypothetical protein